MNASSGTLASAAYAKLRAELLSGAIKPGARLHIRDLCDRMGIGLSPMREALNRLSVHGLIRQSDQRGFAAAPADLEDLADLTFARASMNAIALRDSIARGGAQWEEQLLLAHHRLVRIMRVPGAVCDEWEQQHRIFHTALLAGCRSKRIRDYCEELFDLSDRYRQVSRIRGNERDVAGEHEAILKAALARDADAAVALLDAHVRQTEALVRDAISGGMVG